jgi:hypothetical protein
MGEYADRMRAAEAREKKHVPIDADTGLPIEPGLPTGPGGGPAASADGDDSGLLRQIRAKLDGPGGWKSSRIDR